MHNVRKFCYYGEEAMVIQSWSVDNSDRRFYGCPFYERDSRLACNFFVLFDPPTPEHLKIVILGLLKKKRAFDALLKKNSIQRNWRRLCVLILIVIVLKLIVFGSSKDCYIM
ncbi:hypothetical protein A4A49_51836 [Nicotiana attenuata]|uniref:Zinc finger GRF-type domain-containing protein n=1 Tax=Nicotiana attenuata TaxID=49451 RepID=A0A314L2Q8_NICAT|nr:hypothetical protein A4A49_51836 [Nicotiana attenuata]